jgi:multiple sugar transport system ATP-binding protein
MIYVTHDQVEAMTLGSKVAVMKDGRLFQVDTPLGLYNHPAGRFVAGFIGSPPMNFLEGALKKDAGAVRFASADLTLTLPEAIVKAVRSHVGKAVYLGIRPENIQDAAFLTSADPSNVKVLHTEVVEPLGAETLVYLRAAEHGQDIVARLDSRSSPHVNQDARVAFDMARAHFFDRETEESLTYAAWYDGGLPA